MSCGRTRYHDERAAATAGLPRRDPLLDDRDQAQPVTGSQFSLRDDRVD
jgi:hypothetical protein